MEKPFRVAEFHPRVAVLTHGAGADQQMDMWMQFQISPPSVQHGQDRRGPANDLGIAHQIHDTGSSRRHQQPIEIF